MFSSLIRPIAVILIKPDDHKQAIERDLNYQIGNSENKMPISQY